jgi:hypothetical protein
VFTAKVMGIIVVYDHQSGSLTVSDADNEVRVRLKNAGSYEHETYQSHPDRKVSTQRHFRPINLL